MKKLFTGIALFSLILFLVSCSSADTGDDTQSSADVSTQSSADVTADVSADITADITADIITEPGILSSFTTTDIDGNTVDESIFSDYKLTMVNIWGTFCGPCINEMPELGELNAEYHDKGVQVVGIVIDVLNADGSVSASQVDLAQEIVSETEADYLHLLPSEGSINDKLRQVTAVPETFFCGFRRQSGGRFLPRREERRRLGGYY